MIIEMPAAPELQLKQLYKIVIMLIESAYTEQVSTLITYGDLS
jgi:hypothetical protein